MSTDDAARLERYVQQLTDCQNRLYAYILMLLPNHDDAADVLQETNLTLWRKVNDFTEGTDFGAWACRVAYYQVMARLRDAKRERLVFDENLLALLDVEAEELSAELDEQRRALRLCMFQLSEQERRLLRRRYVLDWPLKRIAREMGVSPGAVATSLYRIRQELLLCIERKLQDKHKP